jgi:type II secretory pathway component PulJ
MGDRYLTAGDLADELKRWLNPSGTVVAEQSSSSLAPPPATVQRQPRTLVTGLAVGGMLAVLGGLAVYVLYPPSPGPGPPMSPAAKEFMQAFGQRPKVMTWEGKRGRGTHEFVDGPNLRALEVSSETVWLVELCEMPTGDFEFTIDFQQHEWTGRVGIILGKHLEAQGDKRLSCDTFQLLRIRVQPAIPGLSPVQFRIDRQKAYIDSPNRIPQTFAALELGTQVVAPPWETEHQRLEFTVRNHRLERVAWNGQDLPELVADVWEQKLAPEDYEGPLGIFVENASVWCSKPVFKILPAEESE